MLRSIQTCVGLLLIINFSTRAPLSAGDTAAECIRVASGVSGHVHPAICVTPAGTILVIFSQSEFKDLRLTRSSDGGKTWSPPIPFPGTEQLTIYPGSLTVLKDGRIVHFWNTWYDIEGMKGKSRYPEYSVSADDGKTWSRPTKLPKNPPVHRVIRHPFIELGDDDWLLPLSDTTAIYHPSNGTLTPLPGPSHGLTPIVRTTHGTLVSGQGKRSTDLGKTWEPIKPFPAINENGWRFDMLALPGDHVLTAEVLGPGVGGLEWRFVLSPDGGKTWDFDNTWTFYKPGRPINGRACPKTVLIDAQTLGTVFYDYSGCEQEKATSGVFFLRTPLAKVIRP